MPTESAPPPVAVRAHAPGAARTRRPRLARLVVPVLVYLTLIALSVLTLLPLVWCVASSFTPLSEIFKYAVPFSWRALIPTDFTLQAYKDLADSSFFGALL